MSKKFFLILLVGVVIVGAALFFRIGNIGTTFLWNVSREGAWLFPLVSVAAIIDSINPCAFSILLLTVAFLFSVGKLRSKILLIGGFYIFGLFVVYISIGLGIIHVLHLFNTPHFMAKVGAYLLMVLGAINIVNELFPAFPIKLRIPGAAHHAMATLMDQASLPAAFLLGILVGLCEFPCTGGPYLMILGLLHDQGTYAKGLLYLVWYNFLFILPLIILLLLAADRQLLTRLQEWQARERKLMRFGGGIVMILFGAFILFL